jgi:hypothetical protein
MASSMHSEVRCVEVIRHALRQAAGNHCLSAKLVTKLATEQSAFLRQGTSLTILGCSLPIPRTRRGLVRDPHEGVIW